MKIVYISSSVIPSRAANSIHVMKMCQALASLGHDVTLLAPDRKDTEAGINDIYSYYGVSNSFKLVKLSWPQLPGRSYIYGLKAARYAKKLQPDLVFGRNLLGCYLSACMALPVMYESHSPVVQAGKIQHFLFKRLISNRFLKRFVVITEALAQYYTQNYPAVRRSVFVAPDGADACADSVTPMQLGDGAVQIGYIGHLYPGRGLELIVNLARRFDMATFHIVGGDEKYIHKLKTEHNLPDNMLMHGFVPPALTDSFRLACDVLIAPYQKSVAVAGGKGDTSRWMSPLKLFEYMAAGKAIVTSKMPALEEVLTHNKTALLAECDDFDDWSAALNRLINEPDFRVQLGQNAQQQFLAEYTWQKRAEKLVRFK